MSAQERYVIVKLNMDTGVTEDVGFFDEPELARAAIEALRVERRRGDPEVHGIERRVQRKARAS